MRLGNTLRQHECVKRLQERFRIEFTDAVALRRCAMTLHNWHELECGNSDAHGSWAIERDGDEPDSPPYLVRQFYHTAVPTTRRTRIPDRENGARKRIAKILKRYPDLVAYVQGDPRGASLYILRKADIDPGQTADMVYSSRGVAVYK